MKRSVAVRHVRGLGCVYSPSDDGPFPAVMILHGSEGGEVGFFHAAAVMLAAHGFLAYAHSYARNGSPWVAGDIVDVPLDRTAEALAVLGACQGEEVPAGLYGVSRGAEHALLVASLMARDGVAWLPPAVAAYSPTDVVVGGFRGVSMLPVGDKRRETWDPADRAWTWRGGHEGLLPTMPIEIERYSGAVFLAHGASDRVWSVAATERLATRLRAAGRDPEVHLYAGEDHALTAESLDRHYGLLLDFLERHLMRR